MAPILKRILRAAGYCAGAVMFEVINSELHQVSADTDATVLAFAN